MLRVLSVFLLALVVASSNLWAQELEKNLERHVRYFSAEKQEGRGVGTSGLDRVAQYIADHFQLFNLKPGGEKGTYFQPVQIKLGAETLLTKNVIGFLEGRESAWQDAPLILGAHYDHLGFGGPGSKARDSQTVHPGADDNASGVAVLLELARKFSSQKPPLKRPLIFIAFTAEELNLLGSKHYVDHPLMPLEKTLAMLNLDMVGRLQEEKLLIFGAGTAAEWKQVLQGINYQFQFDLALNTDDYGASDQAPFYHKDIPVLHFFTGAYTEHHTPDDTWQKLNYTGMMKITEYIAALVTYLGERDSSLTFQQSGSREARESIRSQPGQGAWFGIVPDFAEHPEGMRITGTSKGSPAESAGLVAGDVLIEIDGQQIKNIYDLSQVLKSHVPGDIIQVKYRREEQEVLIHVVLGQR